MFKKVKQYCMYLSPKKEYCIQYCISLQKKECCIQYCLSLPKENILYMQYCISLPKKNIVYSTVYLSQKEYCRYLQAASDCGLLLSGIVHMIVYCNIYSTVGWDNLQ